MIKGARESVGLNGCHDRALARRFRTSMVFVVIVSLVFLALLPCVVPVHGGDESMWVGKAAQPVPEGAKVTLELDRSEYLLGENVLVHFVLQNTGDAEFEASFGSDYRGSSRHLRFKITARDEAGQAAEDPDPFPMCMGGYGGPKTLDPDGKFTTSLPLMRYCDIVKPGVYTIRATHDFGWKQGERKRPVGETTITFRMPNAKQAKRIVSEMAKLPKWPDNSWGERSRSTADFRCLRYPVYLDILANQARDGDERAFEGLGLIPTVKATETLIELAGDPDAKLALNAANTLNKRLPYPESHYGYRLPHTKSSQKPQLTIRGRLVERAWEEKLIPDVRALGAKLLGSEDLPTTAAGAFMITSVGTEEDAPAVLAGINQARNPTHKNRTGPKDNILDTPQPIRELLQAMDALGRRGYSVGEHVSGDAEILLYFHVLRDDPSARPKRYSQFLESFGTSSWFPIREAAVRSIPKPIPPEYRNFVLERLEDEDMGVCRAACAAAGKSGDSSFVRPLLDLIATEQHKWLLWEATNAAQKLDAGYDLLSVWSDRLSEEHLYHLALDALQTVLKVPSGGSSGRSDLSRVERLELRKAWKEFLALHADEIRRGKRFSLSDPAVTPALVGRACTWRLPDGTSWPVRTERVVPN